MGKTVVEKRLELCYLPMEALNVDDAYQRTIGDKLVRDIAREFSWYAFDPLLVGKRKDTSLWVVDGQTRFTVGCKLGHADIAARVFNSQGRQHEAEVFLKANTKRSVKSFDKWRAALCAEEPTTVEIATFVEKAGLSVSYSGHWPNLRCVSKLRAAHEAGVLPQCLAAITHCWPGNADALSEVIMGSLVVFFSHKPFAEVKMDRCKLKWSRLVPNRLLADAEGSKAATGGSRYKAGALVLMSQYNSGLRKNRLEW